MRSSSPFARALLGLAAAGAAAIAPQAQAADLGQHGAVFPIAERSILELIAEKAGGLVESGAWDAMNRDAADRARARIERPIPVAGLSPAIESVSFTYDPTVTAPQDYEDGFGNVVVAKGTTANPLDTVSLPYELVFFDADRSVELDYALERYAATDGRARLVLVSGAPIALMREHRQRFWFDQKGLLTTQLGIRHTPARVFQTGRVLTVEEVALDAADSDGRLVERVR